MTMPYYRCFAQVELSAIGENLAALQGCMAPGVKTMAVVKADAYGHGAVPVSRYIESQVDYLAVACVEEALELRQAGIQKPILILSYTAPARYGDLLAQDVTATLYDFQEAQALSAAARTVGKTAKVHLAVDTGMGRIGLTPDTQGADIAARIAALPNLTVEGLFSHYACADCRDKTDKNRQTVLFDRFIALLECRGVEIPLKHICNSAGTMEPDNQYNMCRLGIAMYGLYPSEEIIRDRVQLRPAMTVTSHVIQVKQVEAGTQIGYGHTYTAPQSQTIATVSVGYADGYNRCMSGTGYVLIRGQKARVVGRVCMDQIMVDVSHIPDAQVGDEAVVLGTSGDAEISAEMLGALSHSFNYEVVCNFMPRVKRIYV